ncbi:MAG: hypothetical protein U0V75_00150 [Ferruginibacter sp.]
MTLIVITALCVSIVIYIFIGFTHSKSVNGLADILPLVKGRFAKVQGSEELSATNVAASISLATVIVAFFDLVPGLGLWLIWPAVTTALGFLLFALLSKKIWKRMAAYNHRPSLHEFIGTEFSSPRLAVIASSCTTLGYLSAFAVELTVGSRFLAGLISGIPEWVTVIIIASVGLLYTALGGFRSVVVSDKIQMKFIWLLLGSLMVYYAYILFLSSDVHSSVQQIPLVARSFQWNNALIPFIVGIFIMNLFTYMSNMGLWQRISGTQDPEIVIKGMKTTVYQSALSWTLFALVAAGAFLVVKPVAGQNLLMTMMQSLGTTLPGNIVLFCVTLGLYGAMLSTASTQLIALSHTLYEDILGAFRKKDILSRIESKKELSLSRFVLVLSAILAVVVVELLRKSGFSVADLAFSIYGAALGLVPVILLSIYLPRTKLASLGIWANISVITGFLSAWVSSFLGKYYNDATGVFLAPVFGLIVSSLFLSVGMLFPKKNKTVI